MTASVNCGSGGNDQTLLVTNIRHYEEEFHSIATPKIFFLQILLPVASENHYLWPTIFF